MSGELKVGQSYSMAEIGAAFGGVAITSEDRIVTDELAWERMTVGRLRRWLDEGIESGALKDEWVVMVDSDPEGNGTHPVRAQFYLGRLIEHGAGVHPDFDQGPPATAVLFGVGY